MSTFQAIWPVVDEFMTYEELKREAAVDLPKVARRHGVIVTGEPKIMVKLGREVPGAGPTALVVVAESPVVEFSRANPVNPKFALQCERCGLEKNARWGVDEYYCVDCKRFAKADGWVNVA